MHTKGCFGHNRKYFCGNFSTLTRKLTKDGYLSQSKKPFFIQFFGKTKAFTQKIQQKTLFQKKIPEVRSTRPGLLSPLIITLLTLPVLKFQLFPFIQVSNLHLFFLHMLILSLQCKPASSSPQTLTAPPPAPCLYFLIETHPYTSQIFSYIIFLPPQPISLPYPLLPCHKQFQWWFWKILSIKSSFLLIVNYCEHKKTYF